MNYPETLDYLYSHLPMYQRIGSAAYKKDLTNTLALCQYLGNPHQQLRCIHVGGTNGKGTVSHALAAILQQHGLRVGLYTSPHYKDFRERIKINGSYIPQQSVIDFVQKIRPAIEQIQPSFFELTVAMAFDYFAAQQVDIAVIEVGLGGRLDSTNVVQPLLSVITNISYDHTDMLGNTLPLIAAEKAGIIKPNTPIVIGETQPETAPVFIATAQQQHAPISFADQVLQAQLVGSTAQTTQLRISRIADQHSLYPCLNTDLMGSYQQKNIVTVLHTVEQLNQLLGFGISRHTVQQALQQVQPLVGLMGRWQTLHTAPLTIADSAHNEGGLLHAMQHLQSLPHQQLHIVLGVVRDKDLGKILPLLPTHATYYFCQAKVPRALPATELQAAAHAYHLHGNAYAGVSEAYQAARQAAHPSTDVVYIGGSIFVVAEIL